MGTAIRRGPSPLGAGGCGGGWRPSPLGCTAALSTVGGCAMLPTASTRWPGGNAEPPCVPGVTCCPPPRKAPVGPQGAAETFTGSWSSLGGSLGVSRALRGVLGSSGGSLGVSWDLRGVLGGLGRVPGGQLGPSRGPGVLGRAPGRPWGEAGPFKGCWGPQASPTETTIATSRWPFIPPQLDTPELP